MSCAASMPPGLPWRTRTGAPVPTTAYSMGPHAVRTTVETTPSGTRASLPSSSAPRPDCSQPDDPYGVDPKVSRIVMVAGHVAGPVAVVVVITTLSATCRAT